MPIHDSFLASFIPMLLYLILLWRMDKNEKEPFLFLSVHFLWGATGAIILGIGGTYLINFALPTVLKSHQLLQIMLIAPVCEETAKGLFIVFSARSKHFDNITDGLVYGGAIGLGFGMTENFFYLVGYGSSFQSWFYIVIVRSLFSSVMHCIATGSFGALLGLAKFSSRFSKRTLPAAGLLIAIMIHFIWNSSVSFEDTYLLGFLFIIACIAAFLLIFKLSIRDENKIIEKELLEECRYGSIPESYVKILASSKRFKHGWIDEKVRRKYYRTAIRLAFSRHQAKNTIGSLREYYNDEIERNRKIIGRLNTEKQVI